MPAPRSQRLPETSLRPLENLLTVSRQWLPQPWQRVVFAVMRSERRASEDRGAGAASAGVRLRAIRAAP